MNSVDFLLTNKDITYEIRTEIKRLGRPIPDLMMGGNPSAWTQEGRTGPHLCSLMIIKGSCSVNYYSRVKWVKMPKRDRCPTVVLCAQSSLQSFSIKMPRTYKRISNRASWSEEDLRTALEKINNKSLSINKASKIYRMPNRTLRRRLENNNVTKLTLGKHPGLGFSDEKRP
ncbi:hypothetical protein NQ318_009021 [Aromia moschata]|uniref:HTH psq-type domain-containing protein n=1 Tax=Aromia moschata TaxID=1265417 RepID=A0AAV8YWI4_9CUCU|nr:hypothetical protein NQ318_009021 [Aromia moschata]